jgi:MerR family transcriptional regulator, heat shock protein HspR
MADMLTRDVVYLSAGEVARAAGITPGRLARLVQAGLVEPVAPGMDAYTAATASRLRRMVRLRADLGVNFIGAAIIDDLVQRLERLDAELIRLRRR